MSDEAKIDWSRLIDDSPYPPQAFEFVRQGLAHTVSSVHEGVPGLSDDESHHVTGAQLCFGLKDYAIRRYGKLARTVLQRWGIHRTGDFGRIVFAMVDAGLMRKTDEDSIEDFDEVYGFDEAFESLEPAPLTA
ncbi:MAG: Minf_1886 family protein [Phycisphaerales bacterium JB037]